MTGELFVSYAQNGEDVLLWRALGHVKNGRYVDVGAWDAVDDSVTKAFYDRGWRGVNVEPVPELADRIRDARPRDETVQAVVTDRDADEVLLHRIQQPGAEHGTTGLSTMVDSVAAVHALDDRFVVEDIRVPASGLTRIFETPLLGGTVHFLKVDVEGAEADVLRSIDFQVHRPWVILVEATEPLSTEATHEAWEGLLIEAGYRFAIFDGLSRYYVADEHPELMGPLGYPVCIFDAYTTAREARQNEELVATRAAHAEAVAESERLWHNLVHWRGVALDSWAGSVMERDRLARRLEVVKSRSSERVAARRKEVRALEEQVERMESSVSWRTTRPLRWVRSQPALRRIARKAAGR